MCVFYMSGISNFIQIVNTESTVLDIKYSFTWKSY